MNMVGTKELETKRLSLRKLRASDAADLHNICGLGESLEEAQNTVNMMIEYNDDPMNYHWVLEYEGHAVGRVKAWEVNPMDDYAQLGYETGEKYRNMGLMSEAIRAIVKYLLTEAGLNRVYCIVSEANIPSCRVCENAGMIHEGNMRRHFKYDGEYRDARVYGILSDEV